ncbi:MAG: hypothetical protein JSS32_00780 [Verrucomicrobia bacterium]|nr:hypothetical protein [Verrucomicrobiota bacterium]
MVSALNIRNNVCNSFLNYSDYIPFLSSATNAAAISVLLCGSKRSAKINQKKYFYEYIQSKSMFRCIVLLVPIIGNIIVVVHDLIALFICKHKSEISPQPLVDPVHLFETFQPVTIGDPSLPKNNAQEDEEDLKRFCVSINKSKFNEKSAQLLWESSNVDFEDESRLKRRDFYTSMSRLFNGHPIENMQNIINVWFSYVYSSLENGIHKLKKSGQNIEYTRLVPLNVAVENPTLYTRLLSLEALVPQPVPNCCLVLNAVRHFFQLIQKVLATYPGDSRVRNLILKNRSELIAACIALKTFMSELFECQYKIIDVFINWRRVRFALASEILSYIEPYEDRKREVLPIINRFYLSKVEWDKEIVGSKKFYLRSQFTQRDFGAKLTPLADEMVRGYAKIKSAWLGVDKRWLQRTWKREIRSIQTVRQLADRPVVEVQKTQKHRILRKYVEEAFMQSQLVFDLKSRQIKWIKENNDGNFSIPLGTITSIVDDPQNGLFISRNQTLAPQILDAIEAQGSPPPNYDQSLRLLLDEYRSCITKRIEGQPLDLRNPLAPLSNGRVIPGVKRGAVPLIFPEEFMTQMEDRIKEAEKYVMQVEGRTLVPFYDFSVETGELKIIFKATYDRYRKDPNFLGLDAFIDYTNYVAIYTVAKFDPLTIRSFSPDLYSENIEEKDYSLPGQADKIYYNPRVNSLEFNTNEFLLQAFYGSLIDPILGMPGTNSFQLTPEFVQVPKREPTKMGKGLSSPAEVAFPGCYRLWEGNPSRTITFNSSLYDGSEHSFEQMLKTENDSYNACQDALKRCGDINDLRDEDKRLFHVLQGLVRLCSSEKWENVKKELEDLGLPEDPEVVFHNPGMPQVNDSPLLSLFQRILANLSSEYQELYESAPKLNGVIEMLREIQ